MGLFSKKTRQEPSPATGPMGTTGATNGTGAAHRGGLFGGGRNRHGNDRVAASQTYSMSKRPSFGQWLKLTWLDILTMVIMGAIGLGVSPYS